METLGKLEAAALAQHAAALVDKLEDADARVRRAALLTLGKLEMAALAPHEQALDKAATDDVYDARGSVRFAAAGLLAKLRAGN